MIGDEIRTRREQLGLSQEDVARAVGTTQQTIQRIETNKTERSGYIPRVLEHLKMSLDISPPEKGSLIQPARTGGIRKEQRFFFPLDWDQLEETIRFRRNARERAAAHTANKTGQIPVFEIIEMPNEDAILRKIPVDYVERGDPLMYSPSAYAVRISSDDMYPALKLSEIALVNPSLSSAIDEPHLFLSDDVDKPAALITVGYLKEITPSSWIVQKFNPPNELRVDRSRYSLCHRIVGKFTRR